MTIKIDNCSFPTNYLYDTQNFTWADFNTITMLKKIISNGQYNS